MCALEERIDQLLTEKNATIQGLEQRLHQLEKELRLARESAKRLRHSLRTLEGLRGGGAGAGEESADGDVRAEVLTLHETLDRMSQQLASSLEESQDLKKRYVGTLSKQA